MKIARAGLLVVPLFALACGHREPQSPPIREAIAVQYVSAADLPVHAKPSDASPVIAKYASGEAVSVLSRSGGWAEVRAAVDGSGWAHADGLSDKPVSQSAEGSPTPRFVTPPSPVYRQGAHGEIVFEGDVNTDGEVIAVRTISNSTGSSELEAMNRAEFQRARFYPLVVNGEHKPFVYEHRITY